MDFDNTMKLQQRHYPTQSSAEHEFGQSPAKLKPSPRHNGKQQQTKDCAHPGVSGKSRTLEKHPLVDLVVVNHNSGQILSSSLPTVLDTRYPRLNIIIVDNGSTDGSTSFLERWPNTKNLTFIKNSKNAGFGAGSNSAGPYLRGKYCAFLNEDLFVTDTEWMRKLVEILEANPDIGAVSPTVLDKSGHPQCSATYFSRRFCMAGPVPKGNIPRQTNDLLEVPYVGVVVTKTNLYRKIGGFRSEYFLYWEDVDYCTRVWLNAHRVCITTGTILKHLHQGSVKKNLSQFTRWYFPRRNSLLFFVALFHPRVTKRSS